VSTLGELSVFESEIYEYLITMVYATRNVWSNVWMESDSTSVVTVFKTNFVHIRLRYIWHNCLHFGV